MRFFDAVISVESESAVKYDVARLCFFNQVRKHPIGKTIQPVIVFEQVFHEITGLKAGIVQEISV